MNAPAPAHKPGNRLPELNPFDLGQERKSTLHPQAPGPAYGCVEWFHYLEHSNATPALPEAVSRRPAARRR